MEPETDNRFARVQRDIEQAGELKVSGNECGIALLADDLPIIMLALETEATL